MGGPDEDQVGVAISIHVHGAKGGPEVGTNLEEKGPRSHKVTGFSAIKVECLISVLVRPALRRGHVILHDTFSLNVLPQWHRTQQWVRVFQGYYCGKHLAEQIGDPFYTSEDFRGGKKARNSKESNSLDYK